VDTRSLRLAVGLGAGALACARQPANPGPTGAALAAAESVYADLRDLRDVLDVAAGAGRSSANDSRPFNFYIDHHNELRRQLARRLGQIDSSSLAANDARAFGVMRLTLARDLDSLPPSDAISAPGSLRPPDCGYDAARIGGAAHGLDSLRQRLYACYGWAQSHVLVDGDTLDRLTVLGSLGKIDDRARRQRLFLSLQPVWQSVNGRNETGSPYRRLIALEARSGRVSRLAEQIRASGIPADSLELWLTAILATWRAVNPDRAIEPWDWYYLTGRSSRGLCERIPRERLTQLNELVYRSLGADLGRLNVQYDLDQREGKTPVAYTTFGARPRFLNGAWRPGQPQVFATYRTGGLDNLNELLHESGHAVHIAAIRTRPAFADWPDSDPFTEAVADLIALDVYDPAWQQRWLGDSVPLTDGLRSRYGGIVMDVAWAVFEMRMLRHPDANPDSVWIGLTRDYLGIRPHPELSWWAMRGQLIDAPGYMMNYAVGAMLSAAIRARTRQLHGPTVGGDSTWYGWIAPRLYRFGQERPTGEVIEEFLGGTVSPAALLADMRRMGQ
jgi:hypothetical protein